jgi:hypothetical protein
MIRKTAAAFIQKGILILILLVVATPVPTSALQYLPEGCYGQITEDQIVVYYFTRKFRCQCCETLENTLLETVKGNYPASFFSGKLALCVINVDAPDIRHFLDEFEILSSSVYIVEKKDGLAVRSLNLEKVWDFLDDARTISRLLMEGLAEYMEDTGRDSTSAGLQSRGTDGKTADTDNKSDTSRKTSKPAHRVRDPEGEAVGTGNQN